MKFLKSFIARIAKYLTEVSAMSDETIIGVDGELVEAGAVASVDAITEALPAIATPDVTETLKAILTALGHDVGNYWDEAVALAKKVL